MENVKGFKDIDGEEARIREKVKEILIKNFKLYGFSPVETPIIEYEDFVKGNNQNDEVISDIFKLQDKGKRNLALRYELTFQLKRLYKNKKLPFKRYQIGEVFRDEPTSSNRFRQFTQCDVDIVGSTIKDEAEILSLAKNILDELNVKATIYINNRKLLNEILDSEEIKNKEEVIREIDKLDKITEEEVRLKLKKYNAEKILEIFKQKESFFEKYPSYKEIIELKDWCNLYGVKVNFLPNLARGLSYYNGNVFEIKSNEMKETIIAGGSYMIDNIQSTGISFGLERLSKLAKIETKENFVLVISLNQDKESINLLKELRKNKIYCSIMYGKPSKALEYANYYKIPYVIFVGEEEIKTKKFKIKDMVIGKEKLMDKNKLIKYLLSNAIN
ncbi:MAG: ATP phosphoribosyltransferase regulatory subunit [Candidatus Pacearchaeota archaeon]